MKQSKRLVALLLSLLLVLSLLPTAALAVEPDPNPDAGPDADSNADPAPGSGWVDALQDNDPISRAELAGLIYLNDNLKMNIDITAEGKDAPGFGDIEGYPEDQQEAIRQLYRAQVISGTSATTFDPAGTVTRAELAVVVWRAAGSRTNRTAMTASFTDMDDIMKDYSWCLPALNCFYGAGMLSGTEENQFKPGDNATVLAVKSFLAAYDQKYDDFFANTDDGALTRATVVEQFYEDFYPVLSRITPTIQDPHSFTDVDGCTEKQKTAIEFFYEREIISGTSKSTFTPYAPVSHYQVATLLYNCATVAARAEVLSLDPDIMLMEEPAPSPFDELAGLGVGEEDLAAAIANPNAPGTTTALATWTEQLVPAAPVFSLSTDEDGVQTVTITAEDGAAIYYTTDGTEPGLVSELYEEPLAVESSTTIRAVAVSHNLISEPAAYDNPDDAYTVTVNAGSNGTVTADRSIARAGDTVTLTVTPNVGYQLDALTVIAGNGSAVRVSQSAPYTFTMPVGNVTVTAAFKVIPFSDSPGDWYGDSGSGSSGSSSGSSSAGSNAASTPSTGTTTSTTTNADGSSVSTTTAADGGKTVESTAADGSKVLETTKPDGSTGTVRTDASGSVTGVEATVSKQAVAAAASSGAPVTLPVEVSASRSSADAAPIDVTMPANSGPVAVDVPVTNVTNTTVAVIVRADGTEEIVKMSAVSADGVLLALDGSATIKIVDNAKSFSDVSGGQWFAENVAWASSHEIMNGMGDGGFAPDSPTSRAMLAQMLFNLDGASGSGAVTSAFADVSPDKWFAQSVTWAYENGIAQGDGTNFNVDQNVTREQMVVMIYNYAQAKGFDTSAGANLGRFTDAGSVSSWAQNAMSWAVSAGIIGGMGDGTVAPQGEATRAQLAAIMERFVRYAMQ